MQLRKCSQLRFGLVLGIGSLREGGRPLRWRLLRHLRTEIGQGHDRRLSDGGPILGFFPQARYSGGEIEIRDRDTLILDTDGVTEPANDGGEEFGEERIRQTLSNARGFRPAKLCEQTTAEVNAFSGAERSLVDDRTLVVIEFLPSETSRQQYELRTALVGAR